MGSRVVSVSNNQQIRGEVKQKNILDGRPRRALQDIGNLVIDQAFQGKKPVTEITATKKGIEKQQPETVIVISSDESSKHKPVNRRIPRSYVKTLTSILTSRSKVVACGSSNKPSKSLVDIDADDVSNELAVVEYIDDMYNFYKSTEVDSRVRDYMNTQPEINAEMRSVLVDWLIEVHCRFEFMPETLFLTINIVDRFLAVKVVPRRELQLVGIGSMLIACKYEEIWAPEIHDFVWISDKAYTREQVLAMEKAILESLEWYLTVPTPYVFLVRYAKASIPSNKEKMENMVFFLAELGLMHYPIVTTHTPSILAAAAVYAARCRLDKSQPWTETLEHHTGYNEADIIDCAKLLVKFHSAAVNGKLKAVYKKFSSVDRGAVALLSPAQSLLDALHEELVSK